MQRSLIPFVVSIVAFFSVLALVLPVYSGFESPAGTDNLFALKLILACSILFVLVAYAGWEAEYGSAFSYYWPSHGAKRIDSKQWEIGIFIRSLFVAFLLAFLFCFAAVSTSDGNISTINQLSMQTTLKEDERRFFSHLRFIDVLLVPVTCAFPLIVLLIYTLIDNHRKPIEKTNLT